MVGMRRGGHLETCRETVSQNRIAQMTDVFFEIRGIQFWDMTRICSHSAWTTFPNSFSPGPFFVKSQHLLSMLCQTYSRCQTFRAQNDHPKVVHGVTWCNFLSKKHINQLYGGFRFFLCTPNHSFFPLRIRIAGEIPSTGATGAQELTGKSEGRVVFSCF